MKPTGKSVAAAAVQAAHVGYTYEDMDCQAFVEHCVKQAGGSMSYRGSNDMARHAAWLGTLENAQAEGMLRPGALLFIHEEDESALPARYVGDGLGDFSHVGLYVGADALSDTDKSGRRRACDVVHSSATMGRVAGSTLQNGWTHVGWAHEIDYGEEAAPGVEPGAGIDQGASGGAAAVGDGLTAGSPAAGAERYAVVASPDGGPVKLRRSASRGESLYWLVNAGARVRVERERDGWALIRAICTDGYTRRAYMMAQYLEYENERE